MGGYLAYTEYKDSGVEWLGKIPTHWKLKSLHHIARLRSGETMTAQMMNENDEFPVYGGNGLRGYYHSYTHDGDYVLIGRQGALCGNINYASGKFWASEHAVVVSPSLDLDTFWLGELLRTMNLNQYSTSAAQPGISVEQIGRLKIPFPPIEEQRSIARFLDYKTAQIDALIAKKAALLEKLAEKRTALISQAVTKGLDSSTPMKDSGVEWMGQIPKHWKTMVVKRTAQNGYKTFTDGDWIESPFITDEGIRLIQTGNVGTGEYIEKGFRYVSEETFASLKCTEVFPNDVLICRLDGPVGRACLAPDLGTRMITSVDNAILKPSKDFDPRFIVYSLSSDLWFDWIQALCRVGGGFRFRISRSILGDLRITAPPIGEQQKIADYLDLQTFQINNTATEIRSVIAKLKEYRTALITNAVTGKIDVRDVKLPELDSLEAA